MSSEAPTDSLAGVVKVRPGQPGDRAYILRSWISSWNHSPMARAMGNSYYRSYAPVMERQYARSNVRIACLSDDPGAIVGFAVLEPSQGIIHYVNVRDKWRQKGVATLLLAAELDRADIRYTHSAPPYIRVPTSWTYAPLTSIF